MIKIIVFWILVASSFLTHSTRASADPETITVTAPRIPVSEDSMTSTGMGKGTHPDAEIKQTKCSPDGGEACSGGGSKPIKAPTMGGYAIGELIENIGRVISFLSKSVEVNGLIKVRIRTPDGLEIDVELQAKVKVESEAGQGTRSMGSLNFDQGSESDE